MSANIAENIAGIKAKITSIRPEAKLVAVSKNHDATAIRAAIAAGQRLFGENRVQEAESKFPLLRAEYPNLELHLIGPLQSNKVTQALELFDVIQTVDREKIADSIAKEIGGKVRTKRFFIQVNIGEEPQKAGVKPSEVVEFYNYCKSLGLNITGLMCIPPAEERAFMYFALLQNIKKQIGEKLELSMGMSGDYEQALELGADYVRIGTAIFGERP